MNKVTWGQYLENFFEIVGVSGLVIAITGFIWNKTRKKATVDISRTEGEIAKSILENQLLEINIQEIIERKADIIEQKWKGMFLNAEKEHYEVKLQMQERFNAVLEEKVIVEKENQMLHKELKTLELKVEEQETQIKTMQKEINVLKQQQNGK